MSGGNDLAKFEAESTIEIVKKYDKNIYVLELAGGMGRLTKILIDKFDKIDVLEPSIKCCTELKNLQKNNSQIKCIYNKKHKILILIKNMI